MKSLNKERTKHFIYISIVGVDKSNYPYYKAKHVTEKIITGSSGIPYTILRATQFHNFILSIVQSFTTEKNETITIPSGMKFQSVDIREVANKLIDILQTPSGLLPDFGGPEILPFEKMVQEYLNITKSQSLLKASAIPGERYELFRSGVNLCPGHTDGKITWQNFLETITEI